MNIRMTNGTGLVLDGLVMKARNARYWRIDRQGVAFETEQVDLASL